MKAKHKKKLTRHQFVLTPERITTTIANNADKNMLTKVTLGLGHGIMK